MREFSFERLVAWQESRKLNLSIYKLTKSFPDEERYGIISQMRRASISVSSNLVEGNSRYTSKDKARFFEISYGSLMELLNQVILSLDLEYLKEENYLSVRGEIEKVASLIEGLRKFHAKK